MLLSLKSGGNYRNCADFGLSVERMQEINTVRVWTLVDSRRMQSKERQRNHFMSNVECGNSGGRCAVSVICAPS